MKKLLLKILPKIIGVRINALSLWSKKAAARRAFLVFCTPRGGKVKKTQKGFLENAKDQLIELDTRVKVQTYRWKGNGPTVLLIHGWESNAHRWKDLIEDLQKESYNIIAFDAPAHGNSTGGILNVPLYTMAVELVTQIYKPFVHIGHSIGGLTCVYHYYKHRPEYLQKLIILGAASELSVIMDDYKRLLGMNTVVMNSLDGLVKQRFGFTINEFSGFTFAKEIDIPGLIIHDKKDPITPVASSRGIHKNWKQSTYIETTGLGHSLYQKEVRNHILEFIKK